MTRVASLVRFVWSGALWATLGSCSLVGLDDFALPECESDEQCLEVNAAVDGGLPENCRAFFCAPSGRCEPHPAEVCDGFDNDCDGLVDEPPADGQRGAPEVALEDTGSVERVRYGVSDDGLAAMAWRDDSFVRFTVLPGGQAISQPARLAYQSNADDDVIGSDLAPTAPEPGSPGCWRGTPPEEGNTDTLRICRTRELAFDLARDPSGESVAFALPRVGRCEGGQLRAGYLDPAEPPSVVLRGPGRRSPTYRGIDVAANFCSGASRPACADLAAAVDRLSDVCAGDEDCGDARLVCRDPDPADEDPTMRCEEREEGQLDDDAACRCGLADPVVAALRREAAGDMATEALAAWRSGREDCGERERTVEALALYLERDAEGSRWVTASNEGVPEVIGQTDDRAAPALAAYQDRGYFLAFGNLEGGAALHFVPAQARPEPNREPPGGARLLPDGQGEVCCTPSGCATPTCRDTDIPACQCMDTEQAACTTLDRAPGCTCRFSDNCARYRQDVTTDPLRDGAELGNLASGFGGNIDELTIAPGTPDEHLRLGLAWTEPTGEGGEVIGFRMVQVSVPEAALQDRGEVVRIEAEGEVTGLQLLYRDRAFLRAGFTRGNDTVDDASDGGWFVVWREAAADSARVVATRIAELDGRPVREGERIVVSGDSASPIAPFAYEASDAVSRVLYVDESSRSVLRGPLSCGD
jgi:hypothetical protein